MTNERFRPGCFGSPLCYKDGHPVCGVCPFARACQPVAAARLEVLHAHFGVKPKPKPAPAPVKRPAPPVNPKFAFIAKALRAGKNPFKKTKPGQKAWWLVCEVLLTRPQKAEFKVFVMALAKMTGSVPRAGDMLRAMLTELLRAGAVVKADAVYKIKRIA